MSSPTAVHDPAAVGKSRQVTATDSLERQGFASLHALCPLKGSRQEPCFCARNNLLDAITVL